MSKVQKAISEARRRASVGGRVLGDSTASMLRVPSNLLKLEDRPTLSFDPARMERHRILPYVHDKAASSAFNVLRTRVLRRMRDNAWQSLMVTGSVPSDGKSTTAINLAIAASQDVTQAVTLVDLDLAKPSIARRLGLQASVGLSDFLTDSADVDDVIYNTEVERLFVVPNFQEVSSAHISFTTKINRLLERLMQLDQSMLVILDMPPVLVSDTVLAFGPHLDALLLVVAEAQTDTNRLKRASQMIEGIPIVGVVLNRSSEGNAGAYY